MNRCEDSRAGRDSRGTAKKTEKEGASRGRKRERQREREEADAKDGPCGEDKMVKKRKKKWLPSGEPKEEPRGKRKASIAGFVVGLLVICSFDIIATELFGGA